ncbi:Sulfotransferase domain [Dillenia turbinata]|uniref:Sulfotransferase n=1 Tax=Dillenia turbinata TaxID=194707 RepID=A0AAN8UNP1_9MAGN
MENPKIVSPSMEAEDFTKECEEVIQSLHMEKNWDGLYLYKYKNFWCPTRAIRGMINFQPHFKALNSDLFLITIPKSGTTWLKALTFAIVNCWRHANLSESPIVKMSPHQLVKFLELDIYLNHKNPSLDDLPSPRIFTTHTPYAAVLIKLSHNPTPIEDAFEMLCTGIDGFGPFRDHVLGYWNASLEKPNKILFLKYEELKNDIIFQLEEVGSLLGVSFYRRGRK